MALGKEGSLFEGDQAGLESVRFTNQVNGYLHKRHVTEVGSKIYCLLKCYWKVKRGECTPPLINPDWVEKVGAKVITIEKCLLLFFF